MCSRETEWERYGQASKHRGASLRATATRNPLLEAPPPSPSGDNTRVFYNRQSHDDQSYSKMLPTPHFHGSGDGGGGDGGLPHTFSIVVVTTVCAYYEGERWMVMMMMVVVAVKPPPRKSKGGKKKIADRQIDRQTDNQG